ncbi:MAG: protease modulator HflC [Candidatus Eisenbacteria bacterium]|uniref:Protein HflC n=1 Tax=Eiseniibacteriota bacterium TaxID=2212470 RepID=A0A7Y2EBN9_UNCEI|nr:protease modulator HflC [Candidatus Eisenbacteria bacterium]
MKVIYLILIGAVLILASNVLYVVKEPEQVIITQFGKPVGEPVTDPGLKFKAPFVQTVHRFDRRFLEWDGDPNQLPTRDKRFIWVDMYARWRITDPLLFFQRLRDERGAQTRLDDILDGETRNAIANNDLVEVIRTSNRTPQSGETVPEDETTLDVIGFGRERIRQEILTKAQTRTDDLGIEILDVQFKRINYVEEVRKKVYDRMIAERRRIADRFRSEGEGEASRIRGEKERELLRIQSEAYKEAQGIVGRADAISTETYAKAYGTSNDAEDFYQFLKTLESYETSVDAETWLLLSTDSEFYKYLKKAK